MPDSTREREAHGVRPELVAHVERVDDVALRLRHLLALLVAHEAVEDDVGEAARARRTTRPAMIIRATQKKRMSKPVTRTVVG